MSSTQSFWLHMTLNSDWVVSRRQVYERVLNEIGKAIEKSSSLVDEVENIQELMPEQRDATIDDEVEIVEYLLGTAFVLCQAYITEVVSRVKGLHKVAESWGTTLSTTSNKKEDILRFGYAKNSSSPVELIDAFANYFKHRDEWHWNWDKFSGKQKATAKVIQEAGARSGSSGNLRQGSCALGNPDFTNTTIFLDILEQWHIGITDAYHKELSQRLQDRPKFESD